MLRLSCKFKAYILVFLPSKSIVVPFYERFSFIFWQLILCNVFFPGEQFEYICVLELSAVMFVCRVYIEYFINTEV